MPIKLPDYRACLDCGNRGPSIEDKTGHCNQCSGPRIANWRDLSKAERERLQGLSP